jgi:bifunctional aspartokinase / homoserine dehydrogenase 1
MKVLKFGGSSVGSSEIIKQLTAIVKAALAHQPVAVVVSAFGGTTDALLQCGFDAAAGKESYAQALQQLETRHLDAVKALLPVQQQSAVLSQVKKWCNEIEDICSGVLLLGEYTTRTRDKLMSYGELLSSYIIAQAFTHNGTPCQWKDSRELIITNSRFGNAVVDFNMTNKHIHDYFTTHKGSLTLLPGFIASDSEGITTTLGRGGSDYTAAILAAALHASDLEIWTDVSGMMTADPRVVQQAKIIPQISYQEAMELSHFGAKVIYPPTIQPVMPKNIPVWIKNTFAPADPGTVMKAGISSKLQQVTGISNMNNIVLLSLEGGGMVGIPGFSKRLFETLASEQINVILITQSSSEHSICVAIEAAAAAKAKAAIDKAFDYEMQTGKLDPLIVEEQLAIIALVGDQMKNHTGISGRMFSALGKNGINIRAIAQGSSERNISAVINTADVRKAINVLHEAFFENALRQVNLYIAGSGNVATKFLQQLQQQQQYLAQQQRIQVSLAGICNSRTMAIAENGQGIELAQWTTLLENGQPASIQAFANAIIQKNLRNSIFIDVTASDAVAAVYETLLRKSIAVVACNKVAASSAYSNYRQLKNVSREFNAPFLFETNVGAGLPVIGTLKDLRSSGDTVRGIEAVLSGTLNFVFNNYNGSRSFSSVVKQAQEEGYTEPDPRLDLSGTDVMRKIMILAREAGETLEMEAIACNGFLPESCVKGSVADFYAAMEKEEAHFKALYDAAAAANCKLKFVARYKEGKASVGLEHIPAQHDFYHLYGKDNIVLFYTARYPEQPMVIKGAGAGADVTASGVFADMMRAAGR